MPRRSWGLDFVHDPGPITPTYFMPQSMGSGLAVFDFDGDGRLDLYFLQNAGPQVLLEESAVSADGGGTI